VRKTTVMLSPVPKQTTRCICESSNFQISIRSVVLMSANKAVVICGTTFVLSVLYIPQTIFLVKLCTTGRKKSLFAQGDTSVVLSVTDAFVHCRNDIIKVVDHERLQYVDVNHLYKVL
jgi:hypothetical protein